MKKICIWLAAACLTVQCSRPVQPAGGGRGSEFADELVLKTTPVHDQGQSDLCWAYAMLATIETDRLMLGDSVTLSTDYVARRLLQHEARRCFLAGGTTKVSMRGMPTRLLHIMEEEGALPFDSYYHNSGTDICTDGVNYRVLARKVAHVARAATSLDRTDSRVADLLDHEIGYLPRLVAMLGMTYTPRQFAHSVCMPGDYVALTSFTHHPFGQPAVLETPDNFHHDAFLNVPIDTLMERVEQSLRAGHAVCWEGDISEPGFRFAEGRADMPAGTSATQQQRQRLFSLRRTTDDHCMELCGLARDRQGRRFFLAKNSWGKDNPYQGFMYLSYDYVRLKTIAVVMHAN